MKSTAIFVLATVSTTATQAFSSSQRPVALAQHPVAKPTQAQLSWMDLEVASMITFNLQTACSLKGGSVPVTTQACQKTSAGFVPTLDVVNSWDLPHLNTDEWAQASADFGAKYVVLVADHMTGFTLWNTQIHNYSIAHTKYKDGGGDIVKDMLASCKKVGLKLGVFYSVHYNWWLGVDDFKVGHPPLGPQSYTQAAYTKLAAAQLGELLELFGEDAAFELWFDGGLNSSVDLGVIESAVAQYAGKDTMCHGCFNTTAGPVRWMGNEAGSQALPCWAALDQPAVADHHGNPLGNTFNPPVADTVLREHYWFWQPGTEQTLKSTQQLMHEYLTSVGRSSNFILNLAPNSTGAVPAIDVARYQSLGQGIKCLFSQEVRRGSTQTMNASTGLLEPALLFNVSLPWSNVSVVLREEQSEGQLIGDFTLECLTQKEGWTPCGLGKLEGVFDGKNYPGIGHKRILLITHNDEADSTMLQGIRVRVHSHFATGTQVPSLRDIVLYQWDGLKC